MSEQSTAVALSVETGTIVLKIGAKTREVDNLTGIAIGHKDAMLRMQNAAFAAAFAGVAHGRYRAAVEIMGFAATATQLNGLSPEDGKGWNKTRTAMLAELVLGRAAPKNGWTAKAQKGRLMARLVQDSIEGKATPPTEAPEDVPSGNPQGDTPPAEDSPF